jgi:prophage regulatory protein
MAEDVRLDRLPAVLEQRGDGRSSLYLDVQRRTWTPPVRLGRASAWPRHEVQALVRARVAGASLDQMRVLVRELLDQRAAMMPMTIAV